MATKRQIERACKRLMDAAEELYTIVGTEPARREDVIWHLGLELGLRTPGCANQGVTHVCHALKCAVQDMREESHA